MEDEVSATSRQLYPNKDGSVIVFNGLDWYKHNPMNSFINAEPSMQWFSIKAPNPDAEEEARSSSSEKEKLNPISVVGFHRSSHVAASGTSIYCFRPDRTQAFTFNVTCPSIGWKDGPNLPGRDLNIVVLDGKLYVLRSGVKFQAFDPNLGTWEQLPDPPSDISMFWETTLLEATKQILVTSRVPGTADSDGCCPDCEFFTYDVTERSWTKLNPFVRKLRGGYPVSNGWNDRDDRISINRKAVAAGNTLYWVWFDKMAASDDLVMHAYDLNEDEWFKGSLNVPKEIFVKDEYLSNKDPLRLIHLCDHKFCFLLQSCIYKQHGPDFQYLNCITIDVSPMLKEDQGQDQNLGGFRDLNISILSNEKYPMENDIEILDTLLL